MLKATFLIKVWNFFLFLSFVSKVAQRGILEDSDQYCTKRIYLVNKCKQRDLYIYDAFYGTLYNFLLQRIFVPFLYKS